MKKLIKTNKSSTIINNKLLQNKTKKKGVMRIRYKRVQKDKKIYISRSENTGALVYGSCGIVILKPTWLDLKKIEYGVKYIKKCFKNKQSKIWVRVYPDIPVSKKPTGIRMGKGKGRPHSFVAKILAGTILFEIDNINYIVLMKIIKILKKAWSFSFKIILRRLDWINKYYSIYCHYLQKNNNTI